MSDPTFVERLQGLLASVDAEVLAVYFYGSRARGSARPDSDVDLALLLRRPAPPTLASVSRDVEALVEREMRLPAEAIILNSAPPDLAHRVLRDGIIVLDRDRAARLRFEVQSRNAYFDMEPIRRLYRRLPA